MSWIIEQKKLWQVTILGVGVIALVGPWAFDLINVPAEFACDPPNVRLYGDFCGLPLSGIQIIGGIIGGLVDVSVRLMEGSLTLIEWGRASLYSLFLLLLVLPLFSTLLLIWRGDGRRRQVFSIVTWGLAAGIALLIGFSRFPKFFLALWGVWLYIALALLALVLEVLALARLRKPG